MSSEERLVEQFNRWERLGRGYALWPSPVRLEPPFRPFIGHYVPPDLTPPPGDDTRKATFLGGLVERAFGRTKTPAPPPGLLEDLVPEPEAERAGESPLYRELTLALPPDVKVERARAEALLVAASSCRWPVAFEIIGDAERIAVQFAASEDDVSLLGEQLAAYFPEATVGDGEDVLGGTWKKARGWQRLVVEFGLSREFMWKLETPRSFDPDPLLAVTAALSDLRAGEVAALQVLLTPARAPWAESAIRAVTTGDGQPFFSDGKLLVKAAREKAASPLLAAVVRIAVKTGDEERKWRLGRGLTGALAQLGSPAGNDLIPLDPEGGDPEADFLARTTHRSGMLLSAEELASLVHLPDASVRSPKLVRDASASRGLPKTLSGTEGLTLGENVHRGVSRPVVIPTPERLKHMHVVGVSGVGKSTLLLAIALQDIEAGRGVAVIDPHGDLVDDLLGRIPASRMDDVIVLDPTDAIAPVGFNVLQARSEVEKILLSSDLTALFKRFSTTWGDKMHAVLANAVQVFLERPGGGTLQDLRRFLMDKEYRDEVLSTVEDEPTVDFWKKEYPRIPGHPEGPILTRLDAFLRPKLLRAVVAEADSKLDVRHVMDSGKVLLVRLAKGEIGEENAALLGSLLVSKFHQVALSRQETKREERRPFYLIIDEFHEVVTPTMASILTGARKYGLGLVLAHQELRQLKEKTPEVASAVLANAATRVCFRVGEEDAEELARGFASFTPGHLLNLGVGEAIARVGKAESDFTLRTLPPRVVSPEVAAETAERVTERSRTLYGRRPRPVAVPSPAAAPPAPRPVPVAVVAPPPAPVELEVVREAVISSHPPPVEVETAPAHPIPPPPMPEPPPLRRTVPPPKVKPLKPQEPVLLGRGGAQHKYLQQLIKKWAEGRGYLATIEKEVLGGVGSVDVALEKDGGKIACEISVTTTAEHECGNLRKCLAGGFDQVVCISLERPFLTQTREMLLPTLSDAEKARLLFVTPEELFSALDAPEQTTKKEKGGTVKGYKVSVNFRAGQGASAQVGSRAVSQVLARSVKRLQDDEKQPPSRS